MKIKLMMMMINDDDAELEGLTAVNIRNVLL
jgi:hypothetical protein